MPTAIRNLCPILAGDGAGDTLDPKIAIERAAATLAWLHGARHASIFYADAADWSRCRAASRYWLASPQDHHEFVSDLAGILGHRNIRFGVNLSDGPGDHGGLPVLEAVRELPRPCALDWIAETGKAWSAVAYPPSIVIVDDTVDLLRALWVIDGWPAGERAAVDRLTAQLAALIDAEPMPALPRFLPVPYTPALAEGKAANDGLHSAWNWPAAASGRTYRLTDFMRAA